MGNTNIKLNADLNKLIKDYIQTMNILATDDIFSHPNNELTELVIEYSIYLNGFFEHSDAIIKNKYLKVIWTVHKLYPLTYFENKSVDTIWLVNACIDHHIYANKIYGSMNNLNDKKINRLVKNYKKFIKSCKKNSNKFFLPTISEDFVWQAHLQAHEKYSEDMKKNLGFTSEYNIRYSENFLVKYRELSKNKKDKIIYYK